MSYFKDVNELKRIASITSQYNERPLVIFGGRDFADKQHVFGILAKALKESQKKKFQLSVVSGMAKGADYIGYTTAQLLRVPVHGFEAQWQLHGRSAGPIRNCVMADYIKTHNGAAIGYWDQQSKGTKHMIEEVKKREIPLQIFFYNT